LVIPATCVLLIDGLRLVRARAIGHRPAASLGGVRPSERGVRLGPTQDVATMDPFGLAGGKFTAPAQVKDATYEPW
jgi:hypothetical protein